MSASAALSFASISALAGFGAVCVATQSPLPAVLLLVGFVVYVGPYSLYLKRKSVHGTIAGSVAGAMPPVVGYCASTGVFDAGAAVLFITFALWQLPHAYAIAIRREADYRSAGIPVLPLVKGMRATKRQMVISVGAFVLSAASLGYFGYAGAVYEVTVLSAGTFWLSLALRGFRARSDVAWARAMFFSSVVIVTALYAAMSVDGRHPTGQATDASRIDGQPRS
ncbi:UbiA family prenyltransferase [Bacillus sp. NP157]|nr:UbiA family prenyltransferase [Bacillus sp. NP157]